MLRWTKRAPKPAPKRKQTQPVASNKRRKTQAPEAPTLPASRSGRAIKTAIKYGDKGELDGAASSFRSTPVPSKAMPSLQIEQGVPAFALPGAGQIYCWGLHAGIRKRFKARVIKIRPTFPRIVVRFEATEDDGTSAIELPELSTAYVTAADIEPMD